MGVYFRFTKIQKIKIVVKIRVFHVRESLNNNAGKWNGVEMLHWFQDYWTKTVLALSLTDLKSKAFCLRSKLTFLSSQFTARVFISISWPLWNVNNKNGKILVTQSTLLYLPANVKAVRNFEIDWTEVQNSLTDFF